MSENYILYLQTDLSPEKVLELIFQPKSIAPLDGTDMIYARGSVYLAHAQSMSETMQEKYNHQIGFPPTVSIRYFPDGVSSVRIAWSILLDGILRWLNANQHNLHLLGNNQVTVLKRLNNNISVNVAHRFWQGEQLKKLNLPYEEVTT